MKEDKAEVKGLWIIGIVLFILSIIFMIASDIK